MKKKTFLLLAAAALFSLESSAGDWPMFRKSPQRVAISGGVSTINAPAAVWRFYLGGSLADNAQWAGDVNGDGVTEIVYIAGGKLLAKLPDDTIVWDSKPYSLERIERVGDIDAAGGTEIVTVARGGKIVIFRGADASVLWEMPQGIFVAIAAVRWADFDGDGIEDMLVFDGPSDVPAVDTVVAYSFAGGAGSPVQLFQHERGVMDYFRGANEAVGDFDGDGALEVLALGNRYAYLFSTADGSLAAVSEDLNYIPYGSASTDVEDVDGDGADELLCYMNTAYFGIYSKRVFLLGWNGTTITRRWEMSASDPAGDLHNFLHNGMTDLDGDGALEVVTSFYEQAAARWSTYVLDAAFGLPLDTLRGARLRGIADVDGDGLEEVMTEGASGSLTCFNYSFGSLSALWSIPSIRPVYVLDPQPRKVQSAVNLPLVPDLDGDGVKELVAYFLDAEENVLAVQVYNAESDPPVLYGSYMMESGTSPLTMQPFENITEPGVQVTMARSDGYLLVFDRSFSPINDPSEYQAGLRIGGYYSGRSGWGHVPVAGDLDGDGDIEVVVRDSRGSLLGLDPRGASLVVPPSLLWERPGEAFPLLVDLDGDGDREIVTGIYKYGGSRVRVVESDGTTLLWEYPIIGEDMTLTSDVVAADVTGDGVKDLLYGFYDRSATTTSLGMLSGAVGADVWPARYVLMASYGGSSFWDVTGDTLPDAISCLGSSAVILDGTSGTLFASAGVGYCRPAAVLDINSDSLMEIVTLGSEWGPRAFTINLGSELWRDTSGRYYWPQLGSFAACPAGVVMLETSSRTPEVVTWNGATGAIRSVVVPAEGRLYGSQDEAIADGRVPGFLGNVTVKEDLTGTGRIGALVGSTDGYLYAIDPCDGSLIWSMNFRFPVGEAVFADTDYDGIDEIAVTSADGYIYGVDREMFPAPGWVYDTDPPSGITDADIDSIETQDMLHAAWEPVPLATSYEYGVLTASGNFVTVPEFINVGGSTFVSSSGLSLRLGARYYVAVRAMGPGGSSSEAISDGVTIVDESPPTITITPSPNPFSPDGDGWEDTTLLSVRLADRRGVVSWRLVIMDAGETEVVRDFGERASLGIDFLEIVEWDGADEAGSVVAAGEYSAVGVARDEAGHETEARATIFVELGGPEEVLPEITEPFGEELVEEEVLEVEAEPPFPDAADAAADAAPDALGDAPVEEPSPESGCGCMILT